MLKKTLYPKTERVKVETPSTCQITEKLDGSNLCIFKLNDSIHFATRNLVFPIYEVEDVKDKLYKGLYQWIIDNAESLQKELRETSCVCGEWLGMGKLKYDVGEFGKKFYMFAKANINDNLELYNIRYYHDLFVYPFESLEIPKYIGVVPVAYELKIIPNKDKLDELYEKYTTVKKRNVEGFVVNYENRITKYVRMKNGKLTEHFDRGE